MTDIALGIDTAGFDHSVRPQDDLFMHVNGGWINNTDIPRDRARYGSFHRLADLAEEAVHEIVKAATKAEPGTAEKQVGDFFQSFMDEDTINAQGWQPVRPLFVEVDECETSEELLALIGRFERQNLAAFVYLYITNDPGNPERYCVFMEQGGLGLPDESYYREESFSDIRDKYVTHIERMFTLAGLPDPHGSAAQIFALENELASAHWDNVRSRDISQTYNLYSWDEVSGFTQGIFDGWKDAIGAPEEALKEIVVRQPSFLEAAAEIFAQTDIAVLKNWLKWQIIQALASFLPTEVSEANFDFYGRTLTGQPEQRVRWKRGISLVEQFLGDTVGRIYAEQYFPERSKAEMTDLVNNLTEAYRQSISSLDWMSEETRKRALEKLEKFTTKIGKPNTWKDYSAIEISPNNLIANVEAANEWHFQREIDKIGQPIDRDEWFMLPQTVNAYYNPGFNEIVFPAAILQPPFFSPDRDAALNYGGIGAVIGHEIGHGFDDNGSQYDGDGRLLNWWTDEDREAFEERTGSLIDQFNALAPAQAPEHFVNGALTIGENIGDLGGLGIAWKAYLLSLNGEEPPVIDGLTGAQRFFISWAAVWRQKSRTEEVVRLITIDPHSPNEFRCNQIVRNLDEFYEAFGVTSDDKLWLDPQDRVQIW